MYFDRYVLRTKNNDLMDIFDSKNIKNKMFKKKALFGATQEVYNDKPLSYNFDYAAYHHLSSTFTKPRLLSTINNYQLYSYNFIYAKTKDNQAIVDTKTWEELEQLDIFKGPANNLKIYFILYDNMIKFSVESQYQALPRTAICDLIKLSIDKCFLNTVKLEEGRELSIYNKDDFEIGLDYSQADFKKIYNDSKKNKKIIFHIDTQKEFDEDINSSKIEYSFKSTSMLEKAIEIAKLKFNSGNIARYVIKCEDSDGKTASITNALNLSDWEQPARKRIDQKDIEDDDYKQLKDFLRI